ncbi:MAG: hypothetical protein KA198_04635 [Chitinophagaceae bacterium]|nr:hypothetical protein [Chitinophagaceae bacterium]
MPIPKTIFQTFKSSSLPWITKWHIYRMKKMNPNYAYEFYTDERIIEFIRTYFGIDTLNIYLKIQVGAAKADFFRYLVLFQFGGIYLDIDSQIKQPLDNLIKSDDRAIISLEDNQRFYVQWAMLYEANHPFLAKTIEIVVENIRHNKYPIDSHKMTGPSAYTEAIHRCLEENPSISYRQFGIDYNGHFKFSYPMSKFFLYNKKDHWKQMQQHGVLK